MYDYNKILKDFPQILSYNLERAKFKKAEYLDKLVLIFKQFISKCQKQISHIIDLKINKLDSNYQKVIAYLQAQKNLQAEQKNIIIAQFLVKPFEKFPFTGHKNQKLFKQQYNLIQKASVLIQQTLTESFKQDQVPSFENNKFFQIIKSHGIGKQTLTKLRLNPQNFKISSMHQISPFESKINSILKFNNECIICVSNSNVIELWDVTDNFCLKRMEFDVSASISTAAIVRNQEFNYLYVGFNDQNPIILSYRLSSWKPYASNVTHTRKITKLMGYLQKYLISGSADGLLCIHDFMTLKVLTNSSHTSGIQDVFIKNSFIYILQKNSSVLQYQFSQNNMNLWLNFRRSISAGYISIIRSPQLTTNFSGIGCHIYGLSQIEIIRKLKMEQSNIINIPQMISDFILLQSKQTSQYFAVCVFQSSSTIRIYSLTTQEQVYEYSNDYTGEVGAAGHLPKIQILWKAGTYILVVVAEAEFEDEGDFIKCYQLHL